MKLLLSLIVLVAVVAVVARVFFRPGASGARPGGGSSPRIPQLRRSLMSKALGDASKVDAWIDYERKKDPSLSEEDYYIRANERWERDNR
jgi:hypothetical protein